MKTSTAILLALALFAPAAYANNDNSAAVSGSNNDLYQATGGGIINNGSGAGASSVTANGGAGGNGGTATATASPVINNSPNNRANADSEAFSASGSKSVAKNGDQSTDVKTEIQAPKRNPVSTAYSGQLVAADDTCMGSTSAGTQAIGFGLSVGSTYQDADCVRRKDARELHNMGLKDAGLALMCQNANVRKAMAATGHFCPESEVDDLIGLSVVEAPTNASRNR